MSDFYMTETEIRFRDHVVVEVDASHVPATVLEAAQWRRLPLLRIGDEIWVEGHWRIGKLSPKAQPSVVAAFLEDITARYR